MATAVGVAGFVRLENDSRTLIDQVSPARLAVNQLSVAYGDQQSGIRGYRLTGVRDFLEPYTDGRSRQVLLTQDLRTLLSDRPALLAGLDESVRAGEIWQQWAERVIDSVDAGSAGPTPVEGEALFDNLRSAQEVLGQGLREARNTARGDVFAALRLIEVLGAVGTGLLLGLGLVLWRNLRRLVIRPLSTLAQDVQLVSDGDFARQLTATGPPEITGLASNIDSMRSRLFAAYDDAERAREQLDEQASNLAAQTESLRRSNEELEQFAYVASHDLQEPLRKVASFCQLLEKRYKGQLDERADQYISFAADGAKRMQLLINDLLQFSHAGGSGTAHKQVDLNAALADALANLDTLRAETGARVDSDVLPTVSGNRTLLTQLFQNLIGNAVKFRDSENAPRVRISVSRSAGTWEICCADNGIGIEPRYAERIFVIFQRLHSKETYSGTGIGLALCRKIVDHHGGRIWVDPTTEPGTRICFTLPVSTLPVNGKNVSAPVTEKGSVHV